MKQKEEFLMEKDIRASIERHIMKEDIGTTLRRTVECLEVDSHFAPVVFDSLQKAIEALVDLAIEMKEGRSEGPVADSLRDDMDGYFKHLSREQCEFVERISAKFGKII